MSSASECQSKFESAINLYWGVVGASLGLTLLNLVVVRICLRKYNQSNPKVAAKIHFGAGGIKILLGILILTVFHPTCPSGCTCYGDSGITPSYAYGMIVLVVGVLWCKRGFDWLKVAAQTEGAVESADDEKQAVTAVPTAEMV